MATDIRLKESLPEITEAVVETYTQCGRTNHLGHQPLPNREAIVEILSDLMDLLYPGFHRRQKLHIGNIEYHVGDLVDGLHDKLTEQIARAMRHEHGVGTSSLLTPHKHVAANDGVDHEAAAQQKTVDFLKKVPDLR